MNFKEERKLMEWASQQSKTLSFDLPERKPGEEPATKKQKDYIRSLLQKIDEQQLNTIGKWQASWLIDQIKVEKTFFTQEKVEEYQGRTGSFRHLARLLLVAAVLAGIIYFLRA